MGEVTRDRAESGIANLCQRQRQGARSPAARVREHDFLYEARTEQIGQKTRQLSVRSRTLDAPGTAPSEQAMPAPAAVGEASQALSSMLAHGLAGTARAGGGHARRPVLHLAHKATSCIAFLGDSPETQSSWQRGDVLRRVYLAMLEEDVHMIAGSDKWESRDCEVRWLVNADGDDPGTGRRSQRRQARRYAMQSLQECSSRSSWARRRRRVRRRGGRMGSSAHGVCRTQR